MLNWYKEVDNFRNFFRHKNFYEKQALNCAILIIFSFSAPS